MYTTEEDEIMHTSARKLTSWPTADPDAKLVFDTKFLHAFANQLVCTNDGSNGVVQNTGNATGEVRTLENNQVQH